MKEQETVGLTILAILSGRTFLVGLITLTLFLLLTSCKGVKEWEETLTWQSPSRLCTGRIRIYPELIKEKRGTKGAEEITYGAELSIKAEC